MVLCWFALCIGKSVVKGNEKKKGSLAEEKVSWRDDEFERGIGPKKLSYNELVSATSNFAEENKLGQGGFVGFIKDI